MLEAGGDAHRAGLPSHGQEEKPIHSPYPKPLGLDDFGIQHFVGSQEVVSADPV